MTNHQPPTPAWTKQWPTSLVAYLTARRLGQSASGLQADCWHTLWAARILCSRGRVDRTVPGYVKASIDLALSLILPALLYVVVLTL